ncbi:M20/M25/M40 family metallo-hydrolase [Bacillus luteolus]|uniref:M20/M25/M40 family metallo-hydrolase n=1 Tax=Litchfieldia luteola TaxID=682179 RepID=A0ABR9QJ40_9BACI|nr:M20/M25/M40 family metallo-hydrolase [Cytobacillus luteolus]MBE4908518.1 M20/M25/M40 family metallo-hydrolase [Cytobacillus luteolus]MBP1941370.1 acetylornithine deacetylase/succinyl-diaminopimelate desuccinylase-like protein [Cytobacillus luteolus]
MIETWVDIKTEAADYLSKLIQINTSNYLENEMEAIQFLVKIAEKNGLYTYVHRTGGNRGNVVISLKPEYENPIVLLSHLDVVPANEEDWEHPPFAGEIIDDVLWGRGTIDTKQMTITHLMTLLLLKRNKVGLNRDVILVATSDEENGSHFGLIPFLKDHPKLLNNSIVFNEGGGFPLLFEDHAYYLCEMGQKGLARVRITAKNDSTSNPYLPNNSSLQAILQVIKAFQTPDINEIMPSSTYTLYSTIASDLGITFSENEFDSFLQKIPQTYVSLFKAMSKTTFSITKWDGGKKHPSLGGQYEVYLDSRPVPSVNRESYEKMLDTILAGLPVEYEILSFSQGYESYINTEHLALFEKEVRKEIPNAKVVPFLSIGGSDSRHIDSSQSQIYGYCPMMPDMSFDKVIKMVHGINERIPLESLRFGIQNMYNIIIQMEGSVKG